MRKYSEAEIQLETDSRLKEMMVKYNEMMNRGVYNEYVHTKRD